MHGQVERHQGEGYEEDPHVVGLHSVVEKEEEQHHHDHDHDHDDKKSVLGKVKAKAKKLKDTIKKHGHGHDHDHDRVQQEHDEDGYEDEDEDEEMDVDSEVHGAPMYTSVAAMSYAPGKGVAGQNDGDDQNNLSYLRRFGPGKEEYVEPPKRGYQAEQRAVSAGLRSDLEKPMVLEEDPHAPKGREQHTEPENYQSKVADPTGEGGREIGISPILNSLEKMKIQEDERSFNPTSAYPGSHDQFSPEQTSAKIRLQNQESEPKSPDASEPRLEHGKQEVNQPQQGGYTEKIATAATAIADKAVEAKNVVASKLGYGTAEKMAPSEGSPETSKSEGEYGKRMAATVQEKLAPVYEKVAGAGSTVMSKVQGSAAERGGVRPSDKGVSVTGYLAEKLKPSEEDKALSEVIAGSLRKQREEPNKAVEEEHGGKVKGRVTESEEVAKRLGSSSQEKSGEDVGSPKKGVVDKLKGAVTSWFGKGGETDTSQMYIDNKTGNA